MAFGAETGNRRLKPRRVPPLTHHSNRDLGFVRLGPTTSGALLTLRLCSRQADQCHALLLCAHITFLDADALLADDDLAHGLILDPGEQDTFTGAALVNASVAGKVARVGAEVSVQ